MNRRTSAPWSTVVSADRSLCVVAVSMRPPYSWFGFALLRFHAGRITRIRRCLDERLDVGLCVVEGDQRFLAFVAHFNAGNANDAVQRLLDRDRADRAGHVLDRERNGFGCG